MTVTIDALTRVRRRPLRRVGGHAVRRRRSWPAAAFLSRARRWPQPLRRRPADGETLVGYAGISRLGRTPPFEYEIHTIGVDPAYQGHGVGRRMLDELLAIAAGGVVYLEVRTDNAPRSRCTKRRIRRSRPAPAVLPDQRRRRLHHAAGGACAMTTILAIESSCDETGVGIARLDDDGTVTLLADEVASSVDEHARFGGVVPEIASRAHLEALGPTMRRALATAGLSKPDIVAATIGPGLAGALLVGVAAAKAYSAAWDVPFYAVNHLGGHLAADVYEHGPLPESVGAAGVRRPHPPAARALARRADRRTRQHRRRRRGRGLRQGGPAAGARLSRAARCSTTWRAPATATRSCSRAA